MGQSLSSDDKSVEFRTSMPSMSGHLQTFDTDRYDIFVTVFSCGYSAND